MSYHVMQATRGAGFRPLTAAMRARSVGTVYNIYSTSDLQPPEPEFSIDDTADYLADMGVDYDVPPDYDYTVDVTQAESEGLTTSVEEEEAATKKKLMIAGGIGAVVLIAGIAVVATRK